MANPIDFGFQFGKSPLARPRDPEQPMRILVLGDFGGNESSTGGSSLTQRRIQRVDIDNFEQLLARTKPTARVPLGDRSEAVVDVEIREMDDFHPDQLYQKLPVFRELRELRKRLSDPKTFEQAAAKLREALPQSRTPPDEQTSAPPNAAATDESDADTLERILGTHTAATANAASASANVDIHNLIDEIVAPYIVPGPDPRREVYLQSLDAAVAEQLRRILHSESFQKLEASWRGLHFLVSNVEGEELQVYVWDVKKSELQHAIDSANGRLLDSLLFERLVTEREEEPWSMLVADWSFGGQASDLSLAASLGAIAAQSGAPFLAAADPSLLGYEAWTAVLGPTATSPDATASPDSAASLDSAAQAQNWQALRRSPVASWIGLAAPRFLLRHPYGAATDAIEAFPFEELEDPASQHAGFLWGAPAFVCATLIATSFLENQWDMALEDQLELGDLPAVTFEVDGETQLKPCAEVYLPERVAEGFLSQGVMPLVSFKNRNAIRLLRFQSIADPASALSGPWV